MYWFLLPNRKNMITAITIAVFAAQSAVPLHAESPMKLTNWKGAIDYKEDGPSSIALSGNASQLGKFTAYGEVDLQPTGKGGALEGEGVAVFKAANGDLLVGVVIVEADAGGTNAMHFHWRDTVRFSDGTEVSSDGRFADAKNRPRGLVVIAIIAILIGLLLPAVQKVR